jgi:hypothetical protein
MTETLARLTRMGPDEIRIRAQQALSKRWGRPPAFESISCAASPAFVDTPTLCSLPQAEKICQHRFDLLGYADLDFGSPIDWHLDPVHHKRAPRKPWYKIPFLDFDQVGDHKIIWELNRHQHLVTLAEAWRLTKDDRFAAELRSQWDHWQGENRYPIGINWASTLEVAFRALSWLWVRHLLGDFHSARSTFTAGTSSAISRLTTLPTRTYSEKVWRYLPSACSARKSATPAAGGTAAGTSSCARPKPRSARMASTSNNPSTTTSTR